MPLTSFKSRIGPTIVFLSLTLIVASAVNAGNESSRSHSSEATSGSVPDIVEFSPNKNLLFNVTKASTEPRIDGRLDDEIWLNAVKLENFVEISPGDNVKPAVDTEAMFAYDEENFYVGFVCHDDSPEKIRATITDRDGIFQDDFIGIIIDTFRDQQNGYEFFVNPHGVQGDLRRTQNNEDSSYDTVWQSGGRINSKGWTAEIAIPFRSLRFPDSDSQSWGIHVLRIRPRDSREQHSWAPISRDEDCLFCQAGVLDGLDGINQGKNIEVLPYTIASQSGALTDTDDPKSGFHNGRADGDLGFGVKYGITSNYTADFTYNPDFSQIESDAAQIDVNNTFALFYPERRPFFLEGNDIFATKIDAVYTRSINNPILAAKLTGKSGKNTVGYILAQDDTSPYTVPFEDQSQLAVGRESYSNVLRLKRDVLSDSYVGLLVTDRHASGSAGSNTTFGADTRIRIKENYGFEAHLQGSHTVEPNDGSLSGDFEYLEFGSKKQYNSLFDGEKFNGYALETSVNRSARHWNFWAEYDNYSPTFRAENGFIRSNNFQLFSLWNGYLFRTDENKVFEIIEPQFSWGRKFNQEGVFKDTWYEPSVWIRFRKQTSMWTGYLWSEERFNDALVPGIRRWQGNVDTQFSKLFTGGFWWRMGRSMVRDDAPRLGYEQSLEVWTTVKPTAQMRLSLDYNRFRLEELRARQDPQTLEPIAQAGDEIYDVFILRAHMTYQFTRNLYMRIISQYVDDGKFLSVDPLLSYKINPFTVFFIGSSHGFRNFDDDPSTAVFEPNTGYKLTDRVFFIKFQYLFRV